MHIGKNNLNYSCILLDSKLGVITQEKTWLYYEQLNETSVQCAAAVKEVNKMLGKMTMPQIRSIMRPQLELVLW